MSNNRGVSMIALIIAIVIMIILASIALNAGNDAYDKAQVAKADAERNQVMQAVETRFGKYSVNRTASPLVGDTIPNDYTTVNEIFDYLMNLFRSESRLFSDDEMINHTREKEIQEFLINNADKMEYTRILRHDDIINLGLDNITLRSEFLVNYYSSNVVGPIN